jgi:DNA-binding transcriptional regulator YdaS (Cro superfamily)
MITNPAERLRQRFGSNADIASQFNVTREAVRLWMKHGIPETRALEIEEATRGYITANEILRFARDKKAA